MLIWLQKRETPADRRLGRIHEALRTGKSISLWDARYASEVYQEEKNVRARGNVQGLEKAEASGGGDTSQVGADHPIGKEFPLESLRPIGGASAGPVRALDSPLLADNEQVAGDAATSPLPNVEERQGAQDNDGAEDDDKADAAKPRAGTVLGSYRLQTMAGPVIFTAVQSQYGPVIYVAPGLNLPGPWSEIDMQRSIEFGKQVSFENIKELINAN